jgi:CrcB protein
MIKIFLNFYHINTYYRLCKKSIIGILTQLASFYWLESENIKYFLMSGLLGGFTTFSGFALDFGSLIEQEKYMPAIFYVMLSVGLSLSCFFLGIKITKL